MKNITHEVWNEFLEYCHSAYSFVLALFVSSRVIAFFLPGVRELIYWPSFYLFIVLWTVLWFYSPRTQNHVYRIRDEMFASGQYATLAILKLLFQSIRKYIATHQWEIAKFSAYLICVGVLISSEDILLGIFFSYLLFLIFYELTYRVDIILACFSFAVALVYYMVNDMVFSQVLGLYSYYFLCIFLIRMIFNAHFMSFRAWLWKTFIGMYFQTSYNEIIGK